ncbi:MAG: hypothetical protein WDZ94_00150 [Patescibacteria group bacterium]
MALILWYGRFIKVMKVLMSERVGQDPRNPNVWTTEKGNSLLIKGFPIEVFALGQAVTETSEGTDAKVAGRETTSAEKNDEPNT